MGKFLTSKQRKELLSELKLERTRRYAERLKVILLLDDGETYKNIASCAPNYGIAKRVREYLKKWKNQLKNSAN